MEKPHLLPPPQQLIVTEWNSHEVKEALEKSRAALLNNLTSISTSQHHADFDDLLNKLVYQEMRAPLLNHISSSPSQHHAPVDCDVLIMELVNVENLFLVNTTPTQNEDVRTIYYSSYGCMRLVWEWGRRDMMFDFTDPATTHGHPHGCR